MACAANYASKRSGWNAPDRLQQKRLLLLLKRGWGLVVRTRADVNDTIGVLRRRLEKPETKELPSLPPAKSLNNSNGQLEESIAKITATLGGEHRQAAE